MLTIWLLYTCGPYAFCHCKSIDFRVSISMMGLIEGLRGLCLITALLHNLILGSKKADVSIPYIANEVLIADT